MLLFLGGIVSCRGEVARIHDEQVYHLRSLSEILARHPGKTDAIVADLKVYAQANEKRLLDARRDRGRLLDKMTDAEKADFARKSVEMTKELREKVRTAIEACPDREKIMFWARQLIL